MQASSALMQKRCTECHTLDRVAGARKDAPGWLATVNRMRALPSSHISEGDAKTILAYLLSENSVDASSKQGELTVGKALVDSHCNRCHTLERTLQATKSPAEWGDTVARMVGYAQETEGFFKPGEDEKIIQFLSATQTPEAKQANSVKPKTPSETMSSMGDIGVASETQTGMINSRSIGVFAGVTIFFGLLLFRRPRLSPPSTKGVAENLAWWPRG